MRLVDYFKRLLNNRLPAYFSYARVDNNEELSTGDIEQGNYHYNANNPPPTVQFTSDDIANDSLHSHNQSDKEYAPLTRAQQHVITTKTSHTQPILPPVFNGISFTIQPEQKVALVSRSGGGKSTLFNLLYRYYSPASGAIYMGLPGFLWVKT